MLPTGSTMSPTNPRLTNDIGGRICEAVDVSLHRFWVVILVVYVWLP